jgi:DNA-binding transcriptional regulator YiaG
MKCIECGAELKTKVVKEYAYDESGLDNVMLLGIEVSRCKNGHEEVSIPRIEDLHRTIAMELVNQPIKLRGGEVRFLRKCLGYSGVAFAPMMGVSPETLSRWENDKEPIGSIADRLLRMMVHSRAPLDTYPLEKLAGVGSKEAPRPPVTLRPIKSGWALEVAPS